MPKGKSKTLTPLPYQVEINPQYLDDCFKTHFLSAFKEKRIIEHAETVLHKIPFQCCHMSNFVKDPQFLEGLKEELQDQIFYEKNNDLYKFQQTDDLKQMSTPHAKVIRKFLKDDVRSWLSEITGITFTDKVDLTCSKYEHTDILLCHDDELDTRRVAFILYLVPPWTSEDGGNLDLFSMDEHGQPLDVVQSLVPSWNSFAWFEVTEASHHQVSEVFSCDKTRLSINGWFHGEPVQHPERYIEPPLTLQPHCLTQENNISQWINPIYMDPEIQGQIQEKFEEDSEIELQGFLIEEKYLAVCEALQGHSMTWSMRGPPNKRHYEQASNDMPEILYQCLEFLRSEELFLTLSNLTGLALHYLAADSDSENESTPGGSGDASGATQSPDTENCEPEEKKMKLEKPKKKERKVKEVNPRCHSEIRRWRHGHYTLLHDTDNSQSEYALDAMLYCMCKGWRQELGGYTSYIIKGEDEELLSVNPSENSFALVYRDQETLRFVKHINSKITESDSKASYYDFHLIYYE